MTEQGDSSFVRFVEPNSTWFRELSQMSGAIFFKFRLGEHWIVEYLSGDLPGLLGYEAAEYLENPALLRDLLFAEDRDKITFMDLPVGETQHVEVRWRHRDGHTVWTSVSYQKRESADGSIVVEGVATDVTELRQTQQARIALQEAAEADRTRLRAAMEAMLDPQFLLQPIRDEEGTIVDFEFIDANEAALRHVHTPREQFLGSRMLEVVPGQQDALLEQYINVLQTGEPFIADGVPYADEMQDGQDRLFDLRCLRAGDTLSLTIRDVTERVEAAEALAASQDRYRMLAQNATDMVYRTDLDGTIEWVSDGVTELLGYTPEEFVGMNAFDQIEPEDRVILDASTADSGPDTRRSLRLRAITRDGRTIWIDTLIQAITDENGEVTGFVGGIRDVDAEVEALQELDRRARTDQLTQIPSRGEGIRQLDALLSAGETAAVAFCDLDNFKHINDTYGHAAGDAVLVEAAHRARESVRSDDLVARFGGDEIMLVMRGVSSADLARTIAEKVRSAVAQPVDTPAGDVTPTISIGVAVARPGDSADTVIAQADAAMYNAKSRGRDRVEVQV